MELTDKKRLIEIFEMAIRLREKMGIKPNDLYEEVLTVINDSPVNLDTDKLLSKIDERLEEEEEISLRGSAPWKALRDARKIIEESINA